MPVIETVSFQSSKGPFKNISLLHPKRLTRRSFETTIITGRNGSHKSTLLKQLVEGLIVPVAEGADSRGPLNPDHHQVLCVSGSVADRFPAKAQPGGMRTAFDVPNYTYVGQRVANNLLSKKPPLEAMLGFALAPSRFERFAWSFFADAHSHAGIRPSAIYTMHTVKDYRGTHLDLLGVIQGKTPDKDADRKSARALPHVSHATAQWLLEEFTYDDFIELQNWVVKKGSRALDVTLEEGGIVCPHLSAEALRLGILTELIRLRDVAVKARHSQTSFSAFELSSGEYHMFSTILAVCFGLDKEAVLLIDEPENNLHPQWQRDLMSSVFGICDHINLDGHVIVSTHSPLVVGSAPQASTVVDLSFSEPRLSLASYGASSDELLLVQFGVGSSRNKVVVDTVQRAVALVEQGDFGSKEFERLRPELQTIRDALTTTDPMVSIIDALLNQE